MKVGFLGLGIMGSRMAANLQKKGYSLVVYNRTRSSAQDLLQNGAEWAQNPPALAKQVDVLISMLSTPEVVEQVALGPDGFLPAMREGTIWMDSSTVNPSFARRMAQVAKDAGVHYLNAPVAGTKGPAENAQLLFLVGGDQKDLETCHPLMEAMGKQVIYAGPAGSGSALKMVYNLLLGMSMLAYSEAVLLGESLGLKRELIFDALQGSAVAAPSATSKRKKIEAQDYSADFPLQWMQKDLQLVSQSAYEVGVALPATNVGKEIYMLAARYGYAQEDMSAIYQFLAEQHGSIEGK